MTDEPKASPFAKLGAVDKALLRHSPPAAKPAPEPPAEPDRSRVNTRDRETTRVLTPPLTPPLTGELPDWPDDLIEHLRRTVKRTGHEYSGIRFTIPEKDWLVDTVASTRKRERKTKENEVVRIALLLLQWDYEQHGERSVLARVLTALEA